MGNVRNPVGPLPSSIYWRRRAVVLCLFALVVTLVVWAVNAIGSSGAGRPAAHGPGGRTPVPSITPGPSTSETGITQRPGGRDTGGGTGGDASGGNAAIGGSGSGGGADGGNGGGAAGGSGTSGGAPLPAGTTLPDCASGATQLRMRSVKNAYDAGDNPVFELTVVNSGGAACKVNFAATAAVVSIVDSSDHHVWASDDCPANRSAYLLQVPAHGSTTYTLRWNRRTSAPQCATPSGAGTADAGTYLAKASVGGLGSAQTSFVLNPSS